MRSHPDRGSSPRATPGFDEEIERVADPHEAVVRTETIYRTESIGAHLTRGGRNGAQVHLRQGRRFVVAVRSDGEIRVGRETLLRLMALYYTSLADGRPADAAALAEVLTALGAPPAPLPSPQPRVPVAFPLEVSPTVATLADLRGCLNLAVRIKVTGTLDGSVWGTDVYTDDSALGAAAVHAGLVKPGETADVVVWIGGPRDAFEGSERHGVTSSGYGPWGGSFRLAPLAELPDAPHFVSVPPTLYSGDDPATVGVRLSDLADSQLLEPGIGLVTVLTGHTLGSVWGTDVYTSDSSLPAAAVHAGVLQAGERGVVRIQIEPGQESYTASTRNGVETSSWGSYSSSFRFVPVECTPQGQDGE